MRRQAEQTTPKDETEEDREQAWTRYFPPFEFRDVVQIKPTTARRATGSSHCRHTGRESSPLEGSVDKHPYRFGAGTCPGAFRVVWDVRGETTTSAATGMCVLGEQQGGWLGRSNGAPLVVLAQMNETAGDSALLVPAR